MKNLLILVLFLCMTQVVFCETETQALQPQNFNEPYAGMEENPLIIEDLANLRWLSETTTVWGDSLTTYYFIQVADIDATETEVWNQGEGFHPIGVTYNANPDYTRLYANYDGQGHCISNLSINNPTNSERSLFGNIKNSSIRNLNLVNISYFGTTSGMVVMALDSEIINCSVSGNINEGVGIHGGLFGYCYSSYISKCFTNVNITVTEPNNIVSLDGFAGGLINSQVDNCYSRGILTLENANYTSVHSFVSDVDQSSINNCYTTTRVVSSNSAILSGWMSESEVNNFFWDTETVNTTNVNNMLENSDLVNVTGYTTVEMKDSETYIQNGWDFEEVWSIDPEINDGYPFLQWLLSSTSNSEVDTNLIPITLSVTNYPNPFNPETTIEFNNPVQGQVSVNIYNLKGQLVKSLLQDNLSQGVHKVIWQGKDSNDQQVASGVYFYRMTANGYNMTKKMLLMK